MSVPRVGAWLEKVEFPELPEAEAKEIVKNTINRERTPATASNVGTTGTTTETADGKTTDVSFCINMQAEHFIHKFYC